MGLKAATLAGRQRRDAVEHTVLVRRQRAQHHHQGGFVKILHIVGRDAHPHGAAPVADFGQLGNEVIQQVLRVRGVMVGDVDQSERGRRAVLGQGHVGAQLRQHQSRRHLPLRMGGVTIGEKFHARSVDRSARCRSLRHKPPQRLAGAFLATVFFFAAVLAGGAAAGESAAGPAACALRCMSCMA